MALPPVFYSEIARYRCKTLLYTSFLCLHRARQPWHNNALDVDKDATGPHGTTCVKRVPSLRWSDTSVKLTLFAIYVYFGLYVHTSIYLT